MAKFIELPFGNYNKESQSYERTMMLVNTERIINIVPDGETACRVTLTGGKVVSVSRRYDTLSSQILNRDNTNNVYPGEEVSAAFDAGYNKAKSEMNPSELRAKQIKNLCSIAVDWFEKNPLSNGWQSRFRKDIRAAMDGNPEPNEEQETF